MERPIIMHSHTPGPWKRDKESPYHLNGPDGKTVGLFHRQSDVRVCELTPELVQIAEMYFDHMKSTSQTSSLPFMMASEVLNKLKP